VIGIKYKKEKSLDSQRLCRHQRDGATGVNLQV